MKSRIIKLTLIVEIIALLAIAIASSRGYQDSWVLEGLEIPFAIFMLTYLVFFFVESDSKWIVLFASICRFTILLLPNLKYDWFQGVAIDQNEQFRSTRFIYDYGYVEGGRLYSATPIMGIFFAIYSEVSSVSVLNSFKYLSVFTWFIYPSIIYFILKGTLEVHKNKSLMKYAVFISSLPVKPEISYIVTGTFIGLLLVFLFLSKFLNVLKTNNRKYLALSVIFSLTLVAAHSYSSIILMIGFSMIFLGDRFLRLLGRARTLALNTKLPIFLITLNSAWILVLINNATKLGRSFEIIILTYANAIMGITGAAWSPTGIRFRFFELNSLDAAKIAIVFHGGDLILLLLTLVGIIIVARRLHSSEPLRFLSRYVLLLWLFFPIQFLLARTQAGLVEYDRIIEQTLVLSPIFIGICLYYIRAKIRKARPVIFILLLIIMIFGMIELYRYQPLAPPSSAISLDLPSDEPIVYVTGLTSVYQRYMIRYAEKYTAEDMLIACDRDTQNQIVGIANYNFSLYHLAYYYPFSRLLDSSIVEREYDLFLIHFPGKSGPLGEKAEIRTKSLILGAIDYSSIIYTNGESFTLAKPFLFSAYLPSL